MNYTNITEYCNIHEYLKNQNKKAIIIYSNTSVKKNNICLSKINFKLLSTETITKDVTKIEEYAEENKNIEVVIAIGGGTAIDIAKYFAIYLNKELTCIPTMLSTNAYSTDKVALNVNGHKETLKAKIPEHILIDIDMLNNSNKENLYGIVDILSIYTALNDWKLSKQFNNERYTKEYVEAKNLLNETLKYISEIKDNHLQCDIKKCYYLIGMAGEITNSYGSGKPESGSEHIFAKELERHIEIPHCIAVANGIIMMMIAQKTFSKEMFNAIHDLNVFDLNITYNISLELIKDVFYNLKPREDRYSIINLLYEIDEKNKERIFNKFKQIMKNYFKN